MANFLLKSFSPQAAKIYSLLQDGKLMSAKDIGTRLRIFPNAVYRAVKQLLGLGFAQEIHGYPVKFQATPPKDAINLLISVVCENFYEILGLNGHEKTGFGSPLPITFLRARSDLLKSTQKDTAKAKNEINYIASGLDVPAQTVLEQKRAIERGAKVRVIVQNLKEVGKESLRTWQKIGAEVKYFPNMEARIFIYDHRIVYFTSYNLRDKEEALGIRFEYAPYAQMMNELFEQRWQAARNIT